MKTNAKLYQEAVGHAKAKSETAEYEGCSVHVNARLGMEKGTTNDAPRVVGYVCSDWTDGTTAATFVDGECVWQLEELGD